MIAVSEFPLELELELEPDPPPDRPEPPEPPDPPEPPIPPEPPEPPLPDWPPPPEPPPPAEVPPDPEVPELFFLAALPPALDPLDLVEDFLVVLPVEELPEADFEVERVITIGLGVDEEDVEDVPPAFDPPAWPPERPAAEVVPPTIPTKASTWHLMVVFDALSTVPFSTTTTERGASRTATVWRTLGGVSQRRLKE